MQLKGWMPKLIISPGLPIELLIFSALMPFE
jgi:hypothetical protein